MILPSNYGQRPNEGFTSRGGLDPEHPLLATYREKLRRVPSGVSRVACKRD